MEKSEPRKFIFPTHCHSTVKLYLFVVVEAIPTFRTGTPPSPTFLSMDCNGTENNTASCIFQPCKQLDEDVNRFAAVSCQKSEFVLQ